MSEMSEETRSGRSTGILVAGGLVVVALIITGLLLPPISLLERIGGGSNESLSGDVAESNNGTAALPGRITLAVSDPSIPVSVSSQTQDEFLTGSNGATSLPPNLTAESDVYVVDYDANVNPSGRAAVALPVTNNPNGMDLYGWDGSAWQFIPSQIDEDNNQIVSVERTLPQALAVVSAMAPPAAIVGAEAGGEGLPVELLPHLSEVSVGSLTLVGGGLLQGEVAPIATGAYEQYLHVTNVEVSADRNVLAALLNDLNAQSSHIDEIVGRAQSGGFQGVNLDYQGVNIAQKAAFSNFVGDLGEALRSQGLKLMITLGTPQVVNDSWSTDGQDWAAIGQIADVVVVQLPLNPTLYGDNDQAEALLQWTTRQINREKVSALISAGAIDGIGDAFVELSNGQALTHFGQLQFLQGSEAVEPATPIEVALSGTASPLTWDGGSLTYRYSYEQSGQEHDVWLGNEASLAYRARLAARNNIRGVMVSHLDGVANGAGYAMAVQSYLGTADMPQPSGAAISWTVRDVNDSVLASGSGDALNFAWDGSSTPGTYRVNADFVLGDNVAALDSLEVTVAGVVAASDDGSGNEVALSVEEESAEETVTEEETTEEAAIEEATEEVATEEAITEETTEEETTTEEEVVAAPDAGTGTAVVSVDANVRLGPGIIYGTIAGGLNTGAEVTLIGRSTDSLWLQIILPDGEQEGWIYAPLITVAPGFEVSSLPIPAVTAVASNGGGESGGSGGGESGGSGGGGTAAPPVSAPPVTNAGFALGGQTHSFANPSLMQLSGMTWVKFQHKWGSGDRGEAVRGRIDSAHANGFKVLLSIPGANTYPSSIDFNGYIQFLSEVAALGPDAIEVWNEQNIDFEWPAGQINPASYVNDMLAPAYNAIKTANPNVMVISGAPAPTGFFGGGCGTNGCDDSAYLQGMAAAGAASYLDCVGAHYNAGATSPYQSTGHPAGNDHYSWFFQPMIDVYSVLGKPICFTELGYLSGEGYGGVPPRFSWAGSTTVAQHAQWLGEAVSIAGNSGQVIMVIVFNVDFTVWGDDPQAGYAIMRPDGSCPACGTMAAAMGL